MSADWLYLSDADCAAKLDRVHTWLQRPDRGASAASVVDDMLDLVGDALVCGSHERFFEHHRSPGAPPTDEGKQKHEERAKRKADYSAAQARDELKELIKEDKGGLREILTTVMEWWQRKQVFPLGSESGEAWKAEADRLVQRCADQTAAALVFENIPKNVIKVEKDQGQKEGEDKQSQKKEGEVKQIFKLKDEARSQVWWEEALERVAARVIVAPLIDYEQKRIKVLLERESYFVTLPPNGLEELVQWCKVDIQQCFIERSKAPDSIGFSNKDHKSVIRFFQKTLGKRIRELPTGEKVPLEPDKSADNLRNRDESTWEEDDPHTFLLRQRLWMRIRSRLNSRTDAIKFWILGVLKEIRYQEWNEIARLALQDRCGILDDRDLPPESSPSVTWEEVKQTFENMANKSRKNPGKLTGDSLKKFYSRAKEEVAKANLQAP